MIALALEAMGGATGLVMSFQHQHLSTAAGTKARGAKPADAATDHEDVDVGSEHPCNPRVIIVAIGAERCALDCCFPC